MALRKVKRVLALVLIGNLLCGTMTVNAGVAGESEAPRITSNEDQTEKDSQITDGQTENSQPEKEEDERQQTQDNVITESSDNQSSEADNQENPKEEEDTEQIQDTVDVPDSEDTAEMPESGEALEEGVLEKEEDSKEEKPDDRTQLLVEEYGMWLHQVRAQAVGNYSTELAKFPASYQTYLKRLHTKHPNWIFVAVDRPVDWDDMVTAESVSGTSKGTNRSLLPKTDRKSVV